jgi:hypothetical protein
MLKKNLSQLELPWQVYNLRYEIKIKKNSKKKPRKNKIN